MTTDQERNILKEMKRIRDKYGSESHHELLVIMDNEIEELKCQLLSISDTCQKCGCNEFLCGHNKRGQYVY